MFEDFMERKTRLPAEKRDKLLATTNNKKSPNFTFEDFMERKTRLELATTSLEGWSSTN